MLDAHVPLTVWPSPSVSFLSSSSANLQVADHLLSPFAPSPLSSSHLIPILKTTPLLHSASQTETRGPGLHHSSSKLGHGTVLSINLPYRIEVSFPQVKNSTTGGKETFGKKSTCRPDGWDAKCLREISLLGIPWNTLQIMSIRSLLQPFGFLSHPGNSPGSTPSTPLWHCLGTSVGLGSWRRTKSQQAPRMRWHENVHENAGCGTHGKPLTSGALC